MPALLLKLLESRAKALTFLEWREAELKEAKPTNFTLEQHGNYLVANSPGPENLWSIFSQALSAGEPVVVLGPLSNETKSILLRQLPEEAPPGTTLVLFTSGSTGQPKAVFHSEASLLASAEQLATGLGAPISQLSLLPAWGMAGIAFHLLLPLFSGKRILWWGRRPLHELPPALESAKTDLLSLNPFLLEMISRNDAFGGKNLDVVSLTAPLTEAHREKFRRVCPGFLREIYGMTEAAGPVLLDGKTLGARTKLASDGELSISGAQLSLGYGNEGKFHHSEEWFATGDQFKLKNDALVFVARKKELIDLGGRKIAPVMIEEIFLGLPEIAECLAFGVVVQGVERVGLVYTRSPECSLSKEALSQKISERSRISISMDMRPFVWRELENIPRLPNGKVSRNKALECLAL
ncbi:MAG: AMP-binding protein [Bdellovibrionota bacterium]